MTDTPIIFSGPMVRALLEGRKTMTRRIVSLQNCEFGSIPPGKLSKLFWEHADWQHASIDRGFPDTYGAYRAGYLHVPCHDDDDDTDHCATCSDRGWSTTSHRLRPKAQAGDRLWVRETVACGACAPDQPSHWSPSFWRREQGSPENRNGLWYQADGLAPKAPITERGRWVNSIHMPRWASRLTLLVSRMRIERLHDIPLSDVSEEGCEVRQFWLFGAEGPERQKIGARVFGNLWEEIHGRESWEANPFVVAISFRVIKANIDSEIAKVAA